MTINSHFIPQFLLRGFAFRCKGLRSYVYVFRKGCSPFETNTKNIAAQGNFYGDESIESILSAEEAQFSELVHRLREGNCELGDKPLIDRFVVHSLVRTQVFRDSVHANTASIVNEFYSEFDNPEYTPKLLETLVDDAMNQPEIIGLLDTASSEDRPYHEAALRERFLHPDAYEKLRQMIPTSLAEIDTTSSVRSAQRQALEGDQALDNRIRDLEKIKWEIQMYPSHSLVLGDIGPLVRGNDSPEWGQIFHGTLQDVWFPLSHSCLLRGQVHGTTERVDSEVVNLVSVEKSMEFFIASQRTPREEGYHKCLGSRVKHPTGENLSEIKKTIRGNLKNSDASFTTEN